MRDILTESQQHLTAFHVLYDELALGLTPTLGRQSTSLHVGPISAICFLITSRLRFLNFVFFRIKKHTMQETSKVYLMTLRNAYGT